MFPGLHMPTNRNDDGKTSIRSSYIGCCDGECVDSGGVQLVDGVGNVSASISGSPDHLPTGHHPTGHASGEGDGGGAMELTDTDTSPS